MRIGGEEDDIDFSQFCILLDAGASTNPSKVSHFVSNVGMSRALSFFNGLGHTNYDPQY